MLFFDMLNYTHSNMCHNLLIAKHNKNRFDDIQNTRVFELLVKTNLNKQQIVDLFYTLCASATKTIVQLS